MTINLKSTLAAVAVAAGVGGQAAAECGTEYSFSIDSGVPSFSAYDQTGATSGSTNLDAVFVDGTPLATLAAPVIDKAAKMHEQYGDRGINPMIIVDTNRNGKPNVSLSDGMTAPYPVETSFYEKRYAADAVHFFQGGDMKGFRTSSDISNGFAELRELATDLVTTLQTAKIVTNEDPTYSLEGFRDCPAMKFSPKKP